VGRKSGLEGTGYPAIDLGHESVHLYLSSCLETRVPALLFTGPDGSGKELTAIDFARRLCCAEPQTCRVDGELCPSCLQAVALEHPGIHLVYPTPTQGAREKEGDDEPDTAKILEEKRQDLFSTHVFSKKVSIRIARARAVIRRAYSKPFGSPYNVFVFVDAHLMREEAQNALLKLVEEPPEHCVVIFITPNPDTILNTIRSRCQRVRFAPLETPVVERILVDYYGVEREAAAGAAALARGDINRAKEIASDFDDEGRRLVFEILERIRKSPESWAIEQALAVAKSTNRDSATRFLDDLAAAYRDVMTGDKTLIINRDRAEMLAAQAAEWDAKGLPAILDKIVTTRDEILRRNLNIEAAFVDLFLDIKHLG
jgi:DNA polymerase-3 subunit delta'